MIFKMIFSIINSYNCFCCPIVNNFSHHGEIDDNYLSEECPVFYTVHFHMLSWSN